MNRANRMLVERNNDDDIGDKLADTSVRQERSLGSFGHVSSVYSHV